MKLLFDFLPLILFFIAYKVWNIYIACGVLIIASGIQFLTAWIYFKRIDKMYLVNFVLIAIFGGITIWLHDPMFLKWKVSIANWLFSLAFLFSQLFDKNIIEHLMQNSPALPKKVYRRLNLMWASFFLLVGTLNIIVAYLFSTAIWVNFKVFGLFGLTLVFVIYQTIYLYKYLKP